MGIDPPPTSVIALAVDDVAAAADELEAKGVEVVLGPMESSVCTMAYVVDPFGNPIMLHQRKDGTVG